MFYLWATRLSCKLLGQEYTNEHLKSSIRKFYGRYGDLIRYYEAPLCEMLHGIMGHNHIQWHPPLIRHLSKSWPCYRTGPYHRSLFWEVSKGNLQRLRQSNRGRLLLQTLVPVPYGLVLMLSLNLSCVRTFWVSNIPRYFYFALFTCPIGSSDDVMVKLLADEARYPGLIPGLARSISQINYLLLQSRNIVEIPLKRPKSWIQPKTDLLICLISYSGFPFGNLRLLCLTYLHMPNLPSCA